jgi:hypothetical protein
MQIVRLATPVLWLSPDFTTSEFSISNLLHFQKIFVRSRRDWKEKMPGRIPTISIASFYFINLDLPNKIFRSPPEIKI